MNTIFLGIIAFCMVVIIAFWMAIATSILMILKRFKDMTYLATFLTNLITYIKKEER